MVFIEFAIIASMHHLDSAPGQPTAKIVRVINSTWTWGWRKGQILGRYYEQSSIQPWTMKAHLESHVLNRTRRSPKAPSSLCNILITQIFFSFQRHCDGWEAKSKWWKWAAKTSRATQKRCVPDQPSEERLRLNLNPRSVRPHALLTRWRAPSLNKPHGNDNNNKQKQRRDRKWLRLNSITRLIREGRVTKEPSVSASSSSSVRLTSCHAKWVHFDWTYALGHCGRGAGGAARFVQMELGQLHRQGST